ncbi:arsenic transporter [Acidisoma cellulosilytica]|uniref:Arsenic transporter n=1 Tax=Acidisoma cellulosilyticum TaxID=2802395 RepID=A0A963YYR3_9PROT|nr:arsenic transporter [Acidisoma cellulosilyticum]MCB8879234.1 arsenic transporter [Acidisoma cellulosilyticum]
MTSLTWLIVILATAGVIIRPWRIPEAVWAVSGALILVLLGLVPIGQALHAVGRGTDVYLFLIGMMLLSEVARREGLFDWLAAFAVRQARGSSRKLFLLIYAVGTVVTAFLSNDATAVVMTPAVFAAAKHARAEPLPYLFVCAFIANAASFLLPISNPANLVLYADHVPPLFTWLGHFFMPSLAAVGATLLALLIIERKHLAAPIQSEIPQPKLSPGGFAAAIGIVMTAILLLTASAADIQLGLPTAIAGGLTTGFVLWRKREAPWATLRGISWLVLPLVAGLFVLVEGLRQTGALAALATWLHHAAAHSVQATAWGSGILLALVCNVMNNLPAGVVASSTIASGHLPQSVTDSLLIGVDLGPNLSITGSLATILWLTAIRREGEDVTFKTFLMRGAIVMPPALVLALAGLLLR